MAGHSTDYAKISKDSARKRIAGERAAERNDQLRDERQRLVKLGLIAGCVRSDAKMRSDYLDKKIRLPIQD
jgi:hypothetical protein